jgi:hypothetical protein
MTNDNPAKTFWVNVVLIGVGVIPLEVEVPGEAEPTIDHVLALYREERHLAGWSEDGKWVDFFAEGVAGIGERNASRKIVQVKPSILMPNAGQRHPT